MTRGKKRDLPCERSRTLLLYLIELFLGGLYMVRKIVYGKAGKFCEVRKWLCYRSYTHMYAHAHLSNICFFRCIVIFIGNITVLFLEFDDVGKTLVKFVIANTIVI